MSVKTPWYNRGRTGEYLRDWADVLLYGENPDISGFAQKCKSVGLSDEEIDQVLSEEAMA